MASADLPDADDLKAAAERHLWGHFTTMGTDDDSSRIIERGEGCYVWDAQGNRYLDGLAGLFVSQVGHGRTEIVEAMARQAEKLAYFPLWTYTHPNAIELAGLLAALGARRHQPGVLHHRRIRGGRVGLEAGPPVLQAAGRAHAPQGDQPLPLLSRHRMGALSITGLPAIRHRSSRWSPAPPRWPTPTATGATCAAKPMPAPSPAPTTSSR